VYISRALALMSLALALVIIVTMILSFNEREFEFMALLFETVSAFGTVGLSTGITPLLNDGSKLVLAVTYVLWSTGSYRHVVMALARRQSMNRALVRYPESKVNVG